MHFTIYLVGRLKRNGTQSFKPKTERKSKNVEIRKKSKAKDSDPNIFNTYIYYLMHYAVVSKHAAVVDVYLRHCIGNNVNVS